MAGINTRRSMRVYQVLGVIGLLLIAGSLGAWAALAKIQGAVIAPGVLVVESYTKKVQHKEGGIIAQIDVKEGDLVKAGQLLIRLDATEARAELGVVNTALFENLAKQARLRAQLSNADKVKYSSELTKRANEPDVADLMSTQENLFKSEMAAIRSRKDQLDERVRQLDDEIDGLAAQLASKKRQIDLIAGELKDLEKLHKQGLVPTTRILALKREKSRLEGELGQYTSSIAQSKGKISETKLQMIQIDDDARRRDLSDLRDADAKVLEMLDRRLALQSKLRRTDIVAPQDGYVHQLVVHTIGGVITPGELLMQIVPDLDEIVIEAHVQPKDIDQVHIGQKAIVRFPAFDRRTTLELYGEVEHVSADLTQPQNDRPPYFAIRVRMTAEELKKLGDNKLKPGMPAEAFIQTRERTPLSYLLQPLSDQIAHTFREGS